MIVTDPEYNRPTRCVCAKCGVSFMKGAWTGAYSKNGSHRYRYENPDDFPLVVLCDKCAREELSAGRVGNIIY